MYVRPSGGYSPWQKAAGRRNRREADLDRRMNRNVVLALDPDSADAPIMRVAQAAGPNPQRRASSSTSSSTSPARPQAPRRRSGPAGTTLGRPPIAESVASQCRRDSFRMALGRAVRAEGRGPIAGRIEAMRTSSLEEIPESQRTHMRRFLRNLGERVITTRPNPAVAGNAIGLWVALRPDRCERTWSLLNTLTIAPVAAVPADGDPLFVEG